MTDAEIHKIAEAVAAIILPRVCELAKGLERPIKGCEEAAKVLGVSPSWVHHHIEEIPHIRRGRVDIFFLEDLKNLR